MRALPQILVTSGLDVHGAYAMAKYQQNFLDHAFGNYADILTRVTLSSAMGDYLNMVAGASPIRSRLTTRLPISGTSWTNARVWRARQESNL